MLKKRNREGADTIQKPKLKKLKIGRNEEQTDIVDSDIGSTFYEFIGKNDCQNLIWKLVLPERDMTSDEKKIDTNGILKSGKVLNLNFHHKVLGKGQGGILGLTFQIGENSKALENGEYLKPVSGNKSSNIIDFMIEKGTDNTITSIAHTKQPRQKEQDSYLNRVFKEISFDIEVSINIVNYRVYSFSFTNSKLNELEAMECVIANDFYLKFFNKAEDTIIVLDFKIKKNFKSIVNQDKENIGYIGIVNEAMTCYMNSMLQTLNVLGSFKKAVFQIPTNDQEDYNSVALSLQRLFYDLMKNTYPVSTNKLVKSFGWSKEDILIQHDVQEFNLHLSEVMKKKMKGTPGEGTFSNLFEGKLVNYIECLNVSYKSEKSEQFCDLQLTVKVRKLLTFRAVRIYMKASSAIQRRRYLIMMISTTLRAMVSRRRRRV
jgi:hypothetical protein